MGLGMKTRQKLTEETAKQYCQAGKKEKGKIHDEFTATTGYNRKYATHVLRSRVYIKALLSKMFIQKEAIPETYRSQQAKILGFFPVATGTN